MSACRARGAQESAARSGQIEELLITAQRMQARCCHRAGSAAPQASALFLGLGRRRHGGIEGIAGVLWYCSPAVFLNVLAGC